MAAVTLQTDGQIKTGRDAAIAALLGAEEIGFSTAPLIASGCIMMRVCHLNTCPVGIATQDPDLRKKFAGKPEHVINFMFFVAEEVREIMASLGLRKFTDMVGRSDLLEFGDLSSHWKAKDLDLSTILYSAGSQIGDGAIRNVSKQDHALDESIDNRELIPAAQGVIDGEQNFCVADLEIKNTDRSAGSTLAGMIALKHGFAGLPEDSITFKFKGQAGQSFGCFATRGMTMLLEGDANDYVGKGLCGGKIAVFPPLTATFKASENIIAGNTVLYGATEGEVFLRGVAGERFAVRNSGASSVVEGVGDHGCEYMTGGTIVVIGPTGRNFAAGMSGGVAYVYDDNSMFPKLCNQEMVSLESVTAEADKAVLKGLLEKHLKYTGSITAQSILEDWENEVRWFVKVMPNDYKRVLEAMAKRVDVSVQAAK